METAASNGSFPSWFESWPDRGRNSCKTSEDGLDVGSTLSPQPQDRWMPAEGSKLFRVVWKKVYFIQKITTKEEAPWVLLKSLSPSKINMLDKDGMSLFKISINYLLVFGTVPYLNTWQLISLPSESLWNIQARMFVTKSSLFLDYYLCTQKRLSGQLQENKTGCTILLHIVLTVHLF